MEQNKATDFAEKNEPIPDKNISVSISAIVKDILSDDINYCKERILESQKTIQDIQCLLRLIRYSSVKEYYGNQQLDLENVGDESLKNILSSQHPTVIAASNQLLQLKARPKREAAKKAQISIKPKLDKIKTKSKRNDHTDKQMQQGSSSLRNNDKTETNNASVNKSTTDSTAVAIASDPPIPVLNESRATRFFTKYRLLIGNTSQYIGEDNSDECTHRWCVYVRRPENEPSASEIIQKVRFHLDASYKPNDIIEVIAEPFSLTKRGWGEFPVRLELYFKSKDKPVYYVHDLKLDKLKTGRYCLELETAVEVALDINPNCKNTSQNKVSKNSAKLSSEEALSSELAKTNIKNIVKCLNRALDSDTESIVEEEFPSSDDDNCSIPDFISLNKPFFIHCVNKKSGSEYLIRVPQKHNCINLKYKKTKQKVEYVKQQKRQEKIQNEEHIKKLLSSNNTNLTSKDILKRRCSEPLPSPPGPKKVKVLESSTSPKRKDMFRKPLPKLKVGCHANTNNNKHESSAAQMTLLKNGTRVGMLMPKKIIRGQSSLLKCNNQNNKPIIKTRLSEMKSNNCKKLRNNSLLFNTSVLNPNFNKNKTTLPKKVSFEMENPKIIIVRHGNSVITKHNICIPQTKEIRLSPERKLLGTKKNCLDTAYNINYNLSRGTLCTFDKEIDHLKTVLGKISARNVIDYALKRVPLYVNPGSRCDIYFDVPSQQHFKNYPLIKQIALEIKRSKFVYGILKALYVNIPALWDYVSILKYSREHGYLPGEHKYWSNICLDMERKSLTKTQKSNTFVTYSNSEVLINYFDELFASAPKDVYDSKEDIDIESVSSPSKCDEKRSDVTNQVLPLVYGDPALAQYIIRSSKTVGMEVKPEEIVAGVVHPSVLELMCSVFQSFVSDVVRKSLGVCRTQGSSVIEPEHIFSALLSRPEFDMLSNQNLGFP